MRDQRSRSNRARHDVIFRHILDLRDRLDQFAALVVGRIAIGPWDAVFATLQDRPASGRSSIRWSRCAPYARFAVFLREGHFGMERERGGCSAAEHHGGPHHLPARITASQQIVLSFFTDQSQHSDFSLRDLWLGFWPRRTETGRLQWLPAEAALEGEWYRLGPRHSRLAPLLTPWRIKGPYRLIGVHNAQT